MAAPRKQPNAAVNRTPADALLWRNLAAVTGVFTVLVGCLMLWNHFSVSPSDPLASERFLAAREPLHADPNNEQLKEDIRTLDLELRHRYFRHLIVNREGAWLLTGGLVLFLITAKRARRAAAAPFLPAAAARDASALLQQARLTRITTVAAALTMASILALWSRTAPSRIPIQEADLERNLAENEATPAPTLPPPSNEELLTQWSRFRGPHGSGLVTDTNLPNVWNAETGEGILWKSPVTLPGFNSPVVWNNRIFLTGGNAKTRAVFCYDATDGKLLWQGNTPPNPNPDLRELEVPEYTGYAAPTAATDGRAVFAIFVTGELIAFDFSGKMLWWKDFGVPDNMYGHSTSLLLWNNQLIVQLDQGAAEDEASRLYALNPQSGEILWEQPRAVSGSWTSPIVIQTPSGDQIVTLAEPWMITYDAATGKELWRVNDFGSDLAPSPILAGGFIIAISSNTEVMAIQPDGEGDVTQTKVSWRYDEIVPDITSPVGNDRFVFLLTTFGDLVCLDTQTGESLGEKMLDREFHASPSLIGDRLLLFDQEGEASFFSADAAMEETPAGSLGEKVNASPAFQPGRILVRTDQHLFAIGTTAEVTP